MSSDDEGFSPGDRGQLLTTYPGWGEQWWNVYVISTVVPLVGGGDIIRLAIGDRPLETDPQRMAHQVAIPDTDVTTPSAPAGPTPVPARLRRHAHLPLTTGRIRHLLPLAPIRPAPQHARRKTPAVLPARRQLSANPSSPPAGTLTWVPRRAAVLPPAAPQLRPRSPHPRPSPRPLRGTGFSWPATQWWERR